MCKALEYNATTDSMSVVYRKCSLILEGLCSNPSILINGKSCKSMPLHSSYRREEKPLMH